MQFSRITLLIVLIITAGTAFAHHSPFLFFDASQIIETEGIVTRVTWRNPHASFEVQSEDADGGTKTWQIEANSVSILRRMNLTRDSVKVGDRVRVAGWPGKRGGADMFVINMLIPGGREIVFMPGEKLRWASQYEGDTGDWLVTEEDLADSGNSAGGIFQVWSTSLANIGEILMFDGYQFSLTEAAAAARADYDLYDNPIFDKGCSHKGMPTIMEQPYPMELIDNGDVITMRMEEGDAVREIVMLDGIMLEGVMPAKTDVGERLSIPMGYSFGDWEGDTLVVTTTRSSWPYVDMTGVLNNEDAIYVERFSPSADGKRLDYSMTITSPEIFSEPVAVEKYWYRIDGAEVKPYGCIEEG